LSSPEAQTLKEDILRELGVSNDHVPVERARLAAAAWAGT
jgi:hypothetical protein